MYKPLLRTVLLFSLISCQNNPDSSNAGAISFYEIPSTVVEGGEPNLFASASGQVYLSWVEYLNDTTDALLFSRLENAQWSQPLEVARGSDWFVNWADFPSLVAYKDEEQSLAAHWLQKSATGTYDYDVRIAQSFDGGKTWGPSFIPHRDGIAAEHGFVSMLPLPDGRIFATWLDGRNTKNEEHGGSEHGHQGAMALRAAIFDKEGNLYEETELDGRVCDCCQTSAAMTGEGLIVAYRGRSEEEIRDIAIVRQVNGEWVPPSLVFPDNWQITGCPVNGPSIKAEGKTVALAWFSMPDEKPQVKVAFSNNSGAAFSAPIRMDDGNPLGRVDVVLLSEKEALVTWLEETEDGAAIKAAKVSPEGKQGESFLLARSDASRQSGFPRMAKHNGQVVFAWSHTDSLTAVKTALIKMK